MESGTSSTHLREYWAVLVRRRLLIVSIVTAALLVALASAFLVRPQYRATVTLQIERQTPDVLTFRDLSKVDYSWAAYSDYYQTQYKIIASMGVARKTVEDLGVMDHPLLVGERAGPGLLARVRGLLPWKAPAVVQDPLDVAASALLGGLQVSPVRNSQLVRLSWTGPDSALTANVANAWANAYIRTQMKSQFEATDQAREFLVDQIGTLKLEIQDQEQALQQYGEDNNILSVDESNNVTLQAMQDIAAKLTESRTALARAQALRQAVLAAPAEALPAVLNSGLIGRLREEYAASESEYTEKERIFKEGWPGLQTLRSKLDQSRERLDVEIERIARQVRAAAESEASQAAAEVRNLEGLLARHENAAQGLKRDAVEYTSLSGEVQKKRETLDVLMKRQNEMALSTRLAEDDTQSTSTNIRVMEPARPPAAPFRPDLKLNLLLGLFFGLGSAVGLAFLLDYLDNTISSPAALERLTELPVLAVIPRAGPATGAALRRRQSMALAESIDLVTHRDARAGVSEAYRELRTSILLSNPGRPPRQIMVTSAMPEEGKTATALNLAVVLAQLGRRVIVVDTDLRRPRLHKAFDLPNRAGASTYLSGLCNDIGSLTVPTGIERLDLLPSGPIPPNPSELLNSPVFVRLGQELLERGYDHILFDSPPVLSVADPLIIASVVEIGIVVVRAGRTPRQSVRLAVDKLRHAGGGPLGVVLNGLDDESAGAYYHRYDRYGGDEPGRAAPEDERASGTA